MPISYTPRYRGVMGRCRTSFQTSKKRRIFELGREPSSADQLGLPMALDEVVPFLQAAAVQMIYFFAALAKGTDVDQPKNLAKSVTFE